jgi:prepilin-type N-terminal cleavage/methylation domain-containing protein
MVTVRKRDAGFTLTELMVVVVIISLLAAVSTPLFSRDNNARKGRDWAKMVAQLLQRARFQSMGDRADIHVLLYRGHVDTFRKEKAGTYTLLNSVQGPVTYDTTTTTKTVAIWDALVNDPTTLPTGPAVPTGGTLSTSPAPTTLPAAYDIVFTSVGSATTSADTTTPANWRIFLRNELLPAGHPDASFVINIGGLTGFISSNDKVTLP